MSELDVQGEISQPPAPFGRRGSGPEIQEWLDQPSHVYFIYSNGRVKIGYSTDWRSRTDRIIQSCPNDAELILVMPGDRKCERDLYLLFQDYAVGAEWFFCDGKLREFLMLYASPEGREVMELIEAE